MERRRVWGGVCGVIVVLGSLVWAGQYVSAGEKPSDRRWSTPDELIQDGQLVPPAPILEVNFQYDVDKAPSLRVKKLTVKQGYAPQYEPLETGYVLSLHDASGQSLFSLTFQIPNQVSDPPPQAGEAADGAPVVFRAMEFSLTVPMPPEAVELQVTDPQGLVIVKESLVDVPVKKNQPNFRSLPHGKPSSNLAPRSRLAWLADWFTETAEAATNSSTALDITFVGDNYTSADLAMFYQDVDRVIAHMLTYEPYTSRSSQIVFHSVENTTVDLGCVHSPTMDRLITCNNTTVTSVVNNAGAPYDKIIVLVNDPNYGGSGGAVAVAYNGSYSPQVAVHEFGHTFGGLLDEYNLYVSNGTLDNKTHANCFAGAPPAADWNGLVALTDYSGGCNYPNWYRPSPCSLMLSLSCTYFNAVSQQQLNAKLDLFAGNPNPTLTLSANPTLIGLTGSSTLSWSGGNVTTCAASGAWSGNQPTTGSVAVSPSGTSSYTLTCSGASSSVTQTVAVSVDSQPPSVSLTAPASGATVGGLVRMSASATDDYGISRVDFYKDALLLGADNTSPYSMSWNTTADSPGSHTLMAKAVDVTGNLGTSWPVGVTVANVIDTLAPAVTISSPLDGATVNGKVNVKAAASDNVAVTRFELYIDGVLKASSSTGGVSLNCNVNPQVKAGPHTITAKAFDGAGNIGTASITVFR